MAIIESSDEPFAWTVKEWSRKTNISRASTNELIRQQVIESAKHGVKRLILTHPKSYLETIKVPRAKPSR